MSLAETPSIVAVIGCTKVGKSYFINTVTPHPSYVPREIAEDTTEICSVPTTLYHDSKRIIFVDTPGITDNRPVTHIVQDLRKFGRPTFSDTSGITVLYVHCIADPIADLDPIESITKLCGPGKTIANLSIITTKWTEGSARSRAAEKERLDTYLTTNNLRAMVGDPQRFDDSKDSAERILMDALKKPPVIPSDAAESGGCCCVQ